MAEPVWITGIGLVSSLGAGVEPHLAALSDPAARPVLDESGFAPFPVHPSPALQLERQIPKRGDQRQMDGWQHLGVYAAGLALDHAGARDLVPGMHLVVAAGGGERDTALDEAVAAELAPLPAAEAAARLNERLARGLRPTMFLVQLPNMLAGNVTIVHGVAGSSRTLMGEEEAGADAVRTAAARLAAGQTAGGGGADIVLVGGSYNAARWDMLLLFGSGDALWRGPWAPVAERQGRGGGMVTGSLGAFLVLETQSHARARGARGLARLAAVATGAARRRGEDTARASAAALAAPLRPLLREGYAVFSGATGAAAPTADEDAFLAGLRESGPAQGPVRHTGDLVGHAVEAAFPASLALAALALGSPPPPGSSPGLRGRRSDASPPPQILVTGFGLWRGEALALVEPIEGGAA